MSYLSDILVIQSVLLLVYYILNWDKFVLTSRWATEQVDAPKPALNDRGLTNQHSRLIPDLHTSGLLWPLDRRDTLQENNVVDMYDCNNSDVYYAYLSFLQIFLWNQTECCLNEKKENSTVLNINCQTLYSLLIS